MTIQTVSIRQLRCFERLDLTFHPRITVLTGENGSGKTSILEALHVAGHIRSFRTPTLKEVIAHGAEAFSVRACVYTKGTNEIHIGYGRTTRIAEIDGHEVARKKEVSGLLPIVTITEQDVLLIQGYPEQRRTFIDQAALCMNENHALHMHKYHHILKQRNALLSDYRTWHSEVYGILTEEAWQLATLIRQGRQSALQALFEQLNTLYAQVVPEGPILSYVYKIPEREQGYASAAAWCQQMSEQERTAKKSLCGPQLDDIIITLQAMTVQRFASRGMQKLLAVLLRVAQGLLRPGSVILLDDVMADFDERRLSSLLETLGTLSTQLVFTAPTTQQTALVQWVQEQRGVVLKI